MENTVSEILIVIFGIRFLMNKIIINEKSHSDQRPTSSLVKSVSVLLDVC